MKTAVYFLLFFGFIALAGSLFFNPVDKSFSYYRDIAPIFNQKCMPCHLDNGPAQLALTSYDDVAEIGSIIKTVIASGYMPAWGPDPLYRHFKNEKVLTDEEKWMIIKWIDEGMVAGIKPKLTKLTKELEGLYLTEEPAYVFRYESPVCVEGKMEDFYVHQPFFLNNDEEIDVSSFELEIDNKRSLHHAWIFIAARREVERLFPEWRESNEPKIRTDISTAMDSVGMLNYLLYTPGIVNNDFVQGMAKKIPRDAVVILQTHYFVKNGRECDQSALKIYQHRHPAGRHINFLVLEEYLITNPPFEIPADSVRSFTMVSNEIDQDLTLLKISPHMHYRGKRIEAFALTPQADTIKLIKIDNWDFNRQGLYSFSPLLKIPKGSRIYALSTFDNTSDNVVNPVLPPIKVKQGMRSVDEMFQLGFEYVPYLPGDEKLTPLP